MDLIVVIVIFVTILGLAVILASVFLSHKCRTSRTAQSRPKTTPKVPSHRRFRLENGKMIPATEVLNASIRTPSLRSHWSAIQSHPSWLWSRLFLPRDDSSSMPDLEANGNHFTRYAIGVDPNSRYNAPGTFGEKQHSTIAITDTVLNPTPSLPRDTDSNRSSVASSFHTCPSRPNLIFVSGRKHSISNRMTEASTEGTVPPTPSLLLPQSKFYVKQEDSNWTSRSPLSSSPLILTSEFIASEESREVEDVRITEHEILKAASMTSPSPESEVEEEEVRSPES